MEKCLVAAAAVLGWLRACVKSRTAGRRVWPSAQRMSSPYLDWRPMLCNIQEKGNIEGNWFYERNLFDTYISLKFLHIVLYRNSFKLKSVYKILSGRWLKYFKVTTRTFRTTQVSAVRSQKNFIQICFLMDVRSLDWTKKHRVDDNETHEWDTLFFLYITHMICFLFCLEKKRRKKRPKNR